LHLTSRGNARQKIFWGDSDRELFLSILARVVSRYDWLCHAYCLMANHYHLLVETPKANLSLVMRQLNGLCTQGFNLTGEPLTSYRNWRDEHFITSIVFQSKYHTYQCFFGSGRARQTESSDSLTRNEHFTSNIAL
jgi:REP element-mobilizing transposase RayT